MKGWSIDMRNQLQQIISAYQCLSLQTMKQSFNFILAVWDALFSNHGHNGMTNQSMYSPIAKVDSTQAWRTSPRNSSPMIHIAQPLFKYLIAVNGG